MRRRRAIVLTRTLLLWLSVVGPYSRASELFAEVDRVGSFKLAGCRYRDTGQRVAVETPGRDRIRFASGSAYESRGDPHQPWCYLRRSLGHDRQARWLPNRRSAR